MKRKIISVALLIFIGIISFLIFKSYNRVKETTKLTPEEYSKNH